MADAKVCDSCGTTIVMLIDGKESPENRPVWHAGFPYVIEGPEGIETDESGLPADMPQGIKAMLTQITGPNVEIRGMQIQHSEPGGGEHIECKHRIFCSPSCLQTYAENHALSNGWEMSGQRSQGVS